MIRSFIKTVASYFILLCVIFIPFPFNITKIQLAITDFIFGRLIGAVAKNIFSKSLSNTHVYSDSISMYILLLLFLILSIIITVVLLQVKKGSQYKERIFAFIYQLALYYLVLQLLKYGADKIFKNQFYTPEPNTLFTPLGKIDKDLLYWSSMGSSYGYNVFLGMLEALAAVFILIKRTRLLGLLLSFGILLNVIAVNFGFDISVKLFSLFLLFVNIYLLFPYCNKLYQLFLQPKNIFQPENLSPVLLKKTLASYFIQWLAIGIICLEVFYPFINSSNYNGDKALRPYLHGAYQVTNIIEGNDTLPAAFSPVKRFFVHKDSYIIFQDDQDEMKDYKLQYDKTKSLFILTDYQLKQTAISFTYQAADSILTLQYFNNGKENKLISKAIDWKSLPLLKKQFHWTVEGSNQ